MAALIGFKESEAELGTLMDRKQQLEAAEATLRLRRLRARAGYGDDEATAGDDLSTVRARLGELDERITPLAVAAGRLRNDAWGPLMRAGVDKSLFARQVERYADVYTSRVSNFVPLGPFSLLRAAKLDLPHDGVVD